MDEQYEEFKRMVSRLNSEDLTPSNYQEMDEIRSRAYDLFHELKGKVSSREMERDLLSIDNMFEIAYYDGIFDASSSESCA